MFSPYYHVVVAGDKDPRKGAQEPDAQKTTATPTDETTKKMPVANTTTTTPEEKTRREPWICP